MNVPRKMEALFRAVLNRKQLNLDMDEELRSHVEMQTQENIEAGDEARRSAPLGDWRIWVDGVSQGEVLGAM